MSKCLAKIKSEAKDLIDTKGVLEEKLASLKTTEDAKKSTLDIAESELKLCIGDETAEKSKLSSLEEALELATNNLSTKLPGSINMLNKKMASTEEEIISSRNNLKELKQQESAVKTKLHGVNNKLQEIKSSMNEKSNGKMLDFLLDQKRSGVIPGYLGRLGDLGGIENKYNVAISTACGALDHCVVKDVATAQRCIELLKQHNVGRTSFIALDKQQHFWSSIKKPFSSPENVSRLFDLIKIENDEVKPAFYYALKNTLVCGDINQAKRIGYGTTRYRVVTLDGSLIEIAGTMSGGGKPSRNRMGESVKSYTRKTVNNSDVGSADISLIETQADELAQKLRENNSQQIELEAKIESLNKNMTDMKTELHKLTIELKSLPTMLSQLKIQVANQKRVFAELSTDKAKVKQIQMTITANRKEYENAVTESEKVAEEVLQINAQINEISGNKVKTLQKKINETEKLIKKMSTEVTKLTVGIQTSERNCMTTKQQIVQLESDIKGFESDMKNITIENDELERNAGILLGSIDEIKLKLETYNNERISSKDEVAELKKTQMTLKASHVEAENKLNDMKIAVEKLKLKIPYWKEKLNKLVLNSTKPNDTKESLKVYTVEELANTDLANLQFKVDNISKYLEQSKPNMQAITDYDFKHNIYLERVQNIEEIRTKRDEMKSLKNDLGKRRHDEFMSGLFIISHKLKEMYQMITLGGDAELDLVDSMYPFAEGVVFNVRPPKKSWKAIANLSGGEKTLSSLSLVFALHYYKPSPLYVMDEIDAALDFRNVSIVANYIKDRTKNSQFIIISLRPNMFELSNRIIGIYKTFDCTSSVTVENLPIAELIAKSDNNKENDTQNITELVLQPTQSIVRLSDNCVQDGKRKKL